MILSSLTRDRTLIALEMNPKISEGVRVSEEEEETERWGGLGCARTSDVSQCITGQLEFNLSPLS